MNAIQKTPWTEDELQVLKANNHLSNKELANLFPERTYSSVAGARKTYGLRMVRTCVMCEDTFISQYSSTKLCTSCNPSGKQDKNSPLVRYGYYKDGATARGLPFELSGPEFWLLWQKPCTYCGSDIETVGIDRIDAAKGYTSDNVTSCCSRCNEMKMADTLDDWLSHMKKVLEHMENNNG